MMVTLYKYIENYNPRQLALVGIVIMDRGNEANDPSSRLILLSFLISVTSCNFK